MTARRLLLLIVLAALFPVVPASGGCNQGACQFLIPGDTTCWKLVRSGCSGSIGSIWYVDGDPEPPQRIGGAVCDACDSEQGHSVTYSYSQKSGWRFCLTIGGGATWRVPGGPGWEVNVEGQVCYDSQELTMITAQLNCAAGTKTEVNVFETATPSTVHVPVTYSKWGLFKRQVPFPPGCGTSYGAQHRDEKACGEEVMTRDIIKYSYLNDFDDLECPPPPGICDAIALTVYRTEARWTGPGRKIEEHHIDEVIRCWTVR